MTQNKHKALLAHQLVLDRCPHCNIANPTLEKIWEGQTKSFDNANLRYWRIYRCNSCGSLVTAASDKMWDYPVSEMYPSHTEADEAIPSKARDFLNQAMDSLQSPAGAVMLAASAVDEMLKQKGYKEGSLYPRINTATKEHLITKDMGIWAHQVRLDANGQRHSDENAQLPSQDDAKKSIEFAVALAEFIFVLPSRVSHGLEESTPKNDVSSDTPPS